MKHCKKCHEPLEVEGDAGLCMSCTPDVVEPPPKPLLVDDGHLVQPLVFEGRCSYKKEDGGSALIAEVECTQDEHMFVRVQSWDETGNHDTALALQGKRVRLVLTVVG